jgi:Mg-chelatase subunit ChlD
MISTNRTTGSTSAASEALVPPAETIRACTNRQRRLTEYIRGHTGEDIAVRLTPFVPTACVMPTSEETLAESDNADLSSKEAQQLADSVDANYLVLISTAPATVDRLPLADQLTADRAQQFGYALHELGHIRYTAIAASASRIKDRVEEEHQEFVKGLWNSCEDAAIENQLAADQSQLAADRLEIVNRSISTLADEFTPDQQAEFSFRDGIEAALYDRGIYETGVCERLCDPDDDQFVFATDADRQAFAAIDESIDNLLPTILTTPDSTDRAEAVLEWWEAEIEPLLSPPDQDEKGSEQGGEDGAQGEDSAPDGQSQDDAGQQGEPSTGQQSEQGDESGQTTGGDEESPPDSCPDSTGEGEDGNESEAGEAGGGTETYPDPSDINTDQRQETPGTDALEYPDVGDEEDAEALQETSDDADTESETSEEASASQENGSSRDEDPGSKTETETETESKTESESEIGANTDPKSSEENASQGDQGDGESSPKDTTDGSESPTDSNESAGESTDEDDEDSAGSPTSDDGDDQEGASEAENGEGHSSDSPSPASAEASPWTGSDGSSQTSLGSFAQAEDDSEDSSRESPSQSDGDPARDDEGTPPEDATSDSSATSDDGPDQDGRNGVDGSNGENNQGKDKTDVNAPDTQDDSENGTAGDVGNSEPSENDQPERSEAETGIPDTSNQNKEPTNGKHEDEKSTELSQDGSDSSESQESVQEAEPVDQTPAHEDSDLEESDALDTDREGARDEAERSAPDEAQLERDLEDVAAALDKLEGEDGGADAAPGSLDELSIMPNTTDVATDQSTVKRWDEADADAGYVADTLRKALKESRRTGNRSGLTSGSFDRRRAGALARGEVNAFQVRQPGDERQYDLVLILDRSGSMRTQISTAEDALVRFAVACEDVGINVGIIDFYGDEARLIKPFSVETQYIQPSLFSKEYAGGTPLADALGIGRELLEQRRNSPLVIVVTDGKPGDADDYQNELARSYAPICGLTLSLGTSKGNVPDRVANNERFYDRHLYVHDSDRITNRLDQFAVMFDGL